MPTSRTSKRSTRTPSRNGNDYDGEHMHPYSGQLDMLCEHKTGYPDLYSPRIGTFPGNGPRPANPFGKTIPNPHEK